MSIVWPLWIVVIVGSVGTAALLTGAGVLVWLVQRAGSKKPRHQ